MSTHKAFSSLSILHILIFLTIELITEKTTDDAVLRRQKIIPAFQKSFLPQFKNISYHKEIEGVFQILANSFSWKCDLLECIHIQYDAYISTDLCQGSNSRSVMLS